MNVMQMIWITILQNQMYTYTFEEISEVEWVKDCHQWGVRHGLQLPGVIRCVIG